MDMQFSVGAKSEKQNLINILVHKKLSAAKAKIKAAEKFKTETGKTWKAQRR